jgi:hypothetical protein
MKCGKVGGAGDDEGRDGAPPGKSPLFHAWRATQANCILKFLSLLKNWMKSFFAFDEKGNISIPIFKFFSLKTISKPLLFFRSFFIAECLLFSLNSNYLFKNGYSII